MKRSCFTLFWPMVIGLLLSCSYPLACMAQGVSVTVPYASTDTSWWTGVAISNLDDSESTSDVTVTFYGVDGDLLAQENIGPIGPNAAYVDFASSIYSGGALPNRYKMVISHQGTQPLSATTFLGNAEGGFGYQTYADNTPGTEITSLPYTISTPGFYYITNDLTCDESDHGITVETNNTTIDLMGFSLIGPGKDAGGDHSGVYMDGRSNVEIRNGTIRGFRTSGILEHSTTGSGHRCLNIRALGNGYSGIYMSGSAHLVKYCTANKNVPSGIVVQSGSTVTGNTCYKNTIDGIWVGSGVTLTGNNCSYNGNHGIYTNGPGSTITGNTCRYNTAWGIFLHSQCLVAQNTATNNDDGNISPGASCTFVDNHAP